MHVSKHARSPAAVYFGMQLNLHPRVSYGPLPARSDAHRRQQQRQRCSHLAVLVLKPLYRRMSRSSRPQTHRSCLRYCWALREHPFLASRSEQKAPPHAAGVRQAWPRSCLGAAACRSPSSTPHQHWTTPSCAIWHLEARFAAQCFRHSRADAQPTQNAIRRACRALARQARRSPKSSAAAARQWEAQGAP